MGKTAAHRLSEDVVALGRAIDGRVRSDLARGLRALLGWQRTLGGFPRGLRAPDATPYVSLYARGTLRGCYGSHEGAPGERLVRAFLRALADTRYGGLSPSEREDLAADVAYIVRARPFRADEVVERFEPGVHGLAFVSDRGATVLLPSVARERGYDASGFLALLAKKTGTERITEGLVWVLDTDEVSSHGARATDARAAAKRFLESLVERDGRLAFEIDAKIGESRHSGVMRHGRIAVAVEALTALGSPKARVASAWLSREIARALSNGGVEGWPDRADRVLGTLALAARAGIDVPLAELASQIDVGACSPWHAAQAASVLGPRTPERLWQRCVASLDESPFAPYALMAAHARGDAAVTERCARAITSILATTGPFAGGARVTPVPETALTAVAIEALAPLRSAAARSAVRAARAFVLARQVLDVPAALHGRVLGAFRASPIAPLFRCDITAHAALAALRRP